MLKNLKVFVLSMCRNHKNGHLLCGILCTRGLIIDGIKALLDSWRHSERNWNSSSPVFFSSSAYSFWFCSSNNWSFYICPEVMKLMDWKLFKSKRRNKQKSRPILKRDRTFFQRNASLQMTVAYSHQKQASNIKANKSQTRDVLRSLSEKSVRAGGCSASYSPGGQLAIYGSGF